MDGDDFDDDFDFDFVTNASKTVKNKWAKTSIDKDLRDVTNTLEDDTLESKKKRKSKQSNFIDSVNCDKPASDSINLLNSEASDEEEEIAPKSKEASLNITITPPGSPSNSPPSTEKPTRGSKRTKKTEQALKKIQKSKVRNNLLKSADMSLAQADREIMSQNLRHRHQHVREEATFELKVFWKMQVFRFEVKQTDKMSKVMEKIAELAGISVNDISIYKDQVSGVAMPRDATVQSQGLSIVSVLHARAKVITVDEDGDTPLAAHTGAIELKLQTKDRRAQPVTVKINASDKMEVVIQKYCEESKIERGKVKFSFDGEQLNPDETAEDLDLEGGECIDVHFLEK